jgi:vacuolar-type H+-ATPase subunit E/Vma4
MEPPGIPGRFTARKRIELQVAQLEKRTENLADEAETATTSTRAVIAQRMAHLEAQREVVAGQEQRLISLSQHLQTQLEGFRTAKEFLKACDVAAEALATVAAASVATMLESLVADELNKLVELRDAAVLTQEEFDCQKAKLLGQT